MPWVWRGLMVKKPGAMTCVRRCKGLASVRDIRVPHVQKMQQGKSRKDFQLYKFIAFASLFCISKCSFLVLFIQIDLDIFISNINK